MREIIQASVRTSIEVKTRFFSRNTDLIEDCARTMARTLESGNKLLLFGNGGSAADCQHTAAEFVNRFRMERPPLPAIALTTDTSIITSIGNDCGFENIFSKQIQALGREGDMAVAISTSGDSPNVIRAAQAAAKAGMTVAGLSGSRGALKSLSRFAFCVDSDVTARIQEVHILLLHILCDLTERTLFHE